MVTSLWQLLKPLEDDPRPMLGLPPQSTLRPDRIPVIPKETPTQQEVDEILDDARLQADAMREAAWAEGLHEGRIEGRKRIEAEIHEEIALQRQALRSELQEIVNAISTARTELWQSQEAEMVAFVLEIARKVIKTEVEQNPAITTQMVKDGLRRVTDKERVQVRVSYMEAAGLRDLREELLAATDGIIHLEIIDDRRISAGGCIVHTTTETIDARIETQLVEVIRVVGEAPG